MHRTTDSEIRAALKDTVLRRYLQADSARVLEEMSLQRGAARVDIAVVNGMLHGYEIKSDRDTLARLPGQISVFGEVLDRVTLVVGWTHAARAMRIVPLWWAVRLVERARGGQLRFSLLRSGSDNPAPSQRALLRLLWRIELADLLIEFGEVLPARAATRDALCTQLLALAPSYSLLRKAVCLKIRRRNEQPVLSRE